MQHRLHTDSQGFVPVLLVIVGILLIVVVGGLLIAQHGTKSKATANPNACVNKSLAAGASGQCVSDLQNMVNSQAFGIDGQLYVKVTGSYDVPTTAAVKVFQQNFQLPQTGTVTPKDWRQLCNSDDPPAAYQAAAKNAGC